MYLGELDLRGVVEIRCGSVVYFGPGSVKRLEGILEYYKKKGIRRVAVVTGRSSYLRSGAWDIIRSIIESLKMEYLHYDGVEPNPTVDHIDEAVARLSPIEPQLVIGIGGGSPLDVSKAVAVLLKYPGENGRRLYSEEFTPLEALPVVAVNLTHGTGSEVDRYAVATIPEERDKSGIGYDCMYPEYSVDDPELTITLDARQTLYTTLDTLNHVIEASTTRIASAYTVMLATETVRLISQYLQKALKDPQDIEARYWLLYASLLGGIAIDCSVVHITHPLEHTISAFKPEVEHGLGLSILLPSVLKVIYPARPKTLATVLAPIIPGLKGDPSETKRVVLSMYEWLGGMGLTQRLSDLGFGENDVPEMVRYLLRSQEGGGSLTLSPVPVTEELISQIYREALYPLK